MIFMAKKILKVAQNETFGERLKRLRTTRGLTQVELAEMIDSSQRAICSYEQNRTDPPLHLLPKISQALDVSLDQLLGLKAKAPVKKKDVNARWTRRFERIDRLPERKQRTILQVIDMALKSTT